MTDPTPTSRPTGSRILRRAAIGFWSVIALCWIVEAIHLPHFFFHEPARFVWTRVIFRTLVVGGVWLWVHLMTRKLLKRLHYLEEFLHVCSWCRKLGQDGEWVTMEEFLGTKFDTKASHGICPTCFRDQLDAHAEEKKAGRVEPANDPRSHTFLN